LSTEELSSATIESLTENINDSVIAPFFFLIIAYIISYFIMITYHTSFLIIIAPILVAMTYRCVNTLDAMVGYKTPKYFLIGWFPARTDDYLNYLPSRITGFLVVISSALINLDWRNSWRIMLRDAKKTLSPNSGYPMAAAAGALHIQLQKVGIYTLGDPDYSIKSDIIGDAIKLSAIAIFLFLVAVIFLIILINYLV
jgi:adenosylcobinamide-phosphate synthase